MCKMNRSTHSNRTPQDTPLNQRKTWDVPKPDITRRNLTPEHGYRTGDYNAASPKYGTIQDSKTSQNGQTYLSSFGKSVNVERRSLRNYHGGSIENDGHWRDTNSRGVASVPASPHRMPPPSPNTPSLWKKIFSFSKRSAASSERDLSDVGRSSTMPSFRERTLQTRSTVYSEYEIDSCCKDSPTKSVSQNSNVYNDTPTPVRRGSGPRFARVVNRLISDLKHSTSREHTPERSYMSYRRSCSDSKTQQVSKAKDEASGQCMLSPESRRKAISVMDINGNASDREIETVVNVRRYKCLPSPVQRQLSGSSTPPIVRFSSDEDITSVHSKRSSISDRISTSDDNVLDDEAFDSVKVEDKKVLDESCDISLKRILIKNKITVDTSCDESEAEVSEKDVNVKCEKLKLDNKVNKIGESSTLKLRRNHSSGNEKCSERNGGRSCQKLHKSQSQRASSPVQWIKHKYRDSRSRTPSPKCRSLERGKPKDRGSGRLVKMDSKQCREKSPKQVNLVKKDENVDSNSDTEHSRTRNQGPCDSSGKFTAEQKGNVKKTMHQMSHPPPTIKPRPKVKRSVSYSPARQAATISAELEEKIVKLLREPPAIRRRESTGGLANSAKNQCHLNARLSGNYVPRRCNSLVSEHVTTLTRRPSLLRSISGSNSTMDTEKIPQVVHSTKSSENCKCAPNQVRASKNNRAASVDLQGDKDGHQFCKSCNLSADLTSKGSGCCHGNKSASAASAKNEVYPNISKSSKRSVAYTRHRHHTVEIGRNLASAKYMEAFLKARSQVGNPSKAAAIASDFISNSSGSEVLRCKHSIDLDSVNENSSKTTASVSKAERRDSYGSVALKCGSLTRQGNIAYTARSRNNSDKINKPYQSSLFLHLGSSLDKEEDKLVDKLGKDTSGEYYVTGKETEYDDGRETSQGVTMEGDHVKSETGQSESVKNETKTRVTVCDKEIKENKLSASGITDVDKTPIDKGSQKNGGYLNKPDRLDKTSGLDRSLDIKPDTESSVGECLESERCNSHKIIIKVTGTPDVSPDSDTCAGVEFRVSRSPISSPERKHRERPKSEILCVQWADESEILTVPDLSDPVDEKHKRKRSHKERPKSELGGRQLLAEALRTQSDLQDSGSDSSSIDQSHLAAWDKNRMRQRRMSTPHPIKMRPSVGSLTSVNECDQSPSSSITQLLYRMKRCRSAPNLYTRAGHRQRFTFFQASSAHAGDLALQPIEFNDTSDDEVTSEETASLGGHSLASSGSGGRHALDQFLEEDCPTFAEALWDHVTLDVEELAFQVGEVIRVTDRMDKDWWYGIIEDRTGWFPAAFVRLHANQMDTADDFVSRVKAGHMTNTMALQKYSSTLLSKEQARTNVVREIVNAEKEYVKHLKDVVEGYVEKARKRPEMFPDTMLTTIFSNIEEIYKFSSQFLQELDKFYQPSAPHLSEIGKCFLVNRHGFEIYSEYCNNHPAACEELRALQKHQKYKHFFEACRLLQQMIEIPLEGFLLTPVQKICKYPLQLKELLKYTRPEHPDCRNLQEALESMRHIAMLINERKRKLESVEKLAEWQSRVEDWEGPDLISQSSELIHSGDMTKVNSNGWHQERVFFLFDHQILYCKKDLLWRDLLIYRGRINLDHCEVHSIQDGKDVVYNTVVKNGLKIYDQDKDKWYLMYCKSAEQKDKWLNAFQQERHRVMLDRANGFNLEEYRGKVRQTYLKKDKKKHLSPKDVSYKLPSTRQMSTAEALQYAQSRDKKTGLLPFLKRKMKR